MLHKSANHVRTLVEFVEADSDLPDPDDLQHLLAAHREVFEYMEQGIVVWSTEGICTMVNSRY